MKRLTFDLDPKSTKVCIIGLLEFLIVLIGGMLNLMQHNTVPTLQEIMVAFLVAALALVTFFSVFLRTGEINGKESS